MTKNLSIIVPYRDRAEHLQTLIPHLAAFFSRAARDTGGNISVTVVQQAYGLEFNSGLMKNIGYLLSKNICDYVCFHDVDYLPIWADYSEPSGFAPIVWYGAQEVADPNGVRIIHNLELFFGGVVLFRSSDFEKVNGYANAYWGWGCEDWDIFRRCLIEDVPLTRRKGTFQRLPHIHRGWDAPGKKSAANVRNHDLFNKRFLSRTHLHPSRSELDCNRQTCMKDEDGLSTTKFVILERKTLPPPEVDERGLKFEIVTVSPQLTNADLAGADSSR
jgi:hypothetical protein